LLVLIIITFTPGRRKTIVTITVFERMIIQYATHPNMGVGNFFKLQFHRKPASVKSVGNQLSLTRGSMEVCSWTHRTDPKDKFTTRKSPEGITQQFFP